ncbi:MAG: DNA-3-methyladenine glycosylase I [Ignavibacteriae bacterium HGW-Ignavibacteriae-4]|jgi:DNA-3-methyladenine glycosylase I|nr:MAG: DNA-3-methyladenine glycosylase I [Ignavibacteriae bacterium HGW-Ignavibacteriae-4]
MEEKIIVRCPWCGDDPLYMEYHDKEWGKPLHDDQKLFEFLVLESFQAGLSWITILRKRENFRVAFDNFDAKKVAKYGEKEIVKLLADSGIVRNRAKIEAAINNANIFLEIQKEHSTFDKYIWQFVDYKPILNKRRSMTEVPAITPEATQMSKTLKKRGFKFIGPTTSYAFMQATGMVNDHFVGCDFY